MHHLPRPHLAPLLHTWSVEFARVRRQVAALGVTLPPISAVREGRELGLRRTRFWRVMNQRRRLYACHWAGWRPERTSTRWGYTGRKWLLSHGPRIGRARAASSAPSR